MRSRNGAYIPHSSYHREKLQNLKALLDSRGVIVERLVEYMSFKTYYETTNTKDEVPLHEFTERVPRDHPRTVSFFAFTQFFFPGSLICVCFAFLASSQQIITIVRSHLKDCREFS